MRLCQLQLTSHPSKTPDIVQKIKLNKQSPQDRFLFIKVQFSLCTQTALIERRASKILWEALLLKEGFGGVWKEEKVRRTKGYSSENVCICMYLYTDISKVQQLICCPYFVHYNKVLLWLRIRKLGGNNYCKPAVLMKQSRVRPTYASVGNATSNFASNVYL
jgi:hypothetical protein